jgi:hypothetical protein
MGVFFAYYLKNAGFLKEEEDGNILSLFNNRREGNNKIFVI